MEQLTQNELRITIDLLKTRQQLIEAHGQLLQYQHAELAGQIAKAQGDLDAPGAEVGRTGQTPVE